ncbi:MAG: hypothetical protein ACRC1W_03755 [Shewanella sp.]
MSSPPPKRDAKFRFYDVKVQDGPGSNNLSSDPLILASSPVNRGDFGSKFFNDSGSPNRRGHTPVTRVNPVQGVAYRGRIVGTNPQGGLKIEMPFGEIETDYVRIGQPMRMQNSGQQVSGRGGVIAVKNGETWQVLGVFE